MPKLKTFVIKLMPVFILISCSTIKGNARYTHLENIYYTKAKIERQKGEVYVCRQKKCPGIVLVHGGGWKSRSLEDMDAIAVSLATHGFTVFNINYRLAPKHRHPIPINDLKTALDYFKANHKRFRVDPHNISLWGYSSGGHTVSYFATQYPNEIKAVVSGGAPYHLYWYPKSPYILAYLGTYREGAIKKYEQASPITHVSSKLPPFFLYHAIQDRLVEWVQTGAFEAKLQKYKVPVERFDIPYWGHTWAFVFSKDTTRAALKFLRKYQFSKRNDRKENR